MVHQDRLLRYFLYFLTKIVFCSQISDGQTQLAKVRDKEITNQEKEIKGVE